MRTGLLGLRYVDRHLMCKQKDASRLAASSQLGLTEYAAVEAGGPSGWLWRVCQVMYTRTRGLCTICTRPGAAMPRGIIYPESTSSPLGEKYPLQPMTFYQLLQIFCKTSSADGSLIRLHPRPSNPSARGTRHRSQMNRGTSC